MIEVPAEAQAVVLRAAVEGVLAKAGELRTRVAGVYDRAAAQWEAQGDACKQALCTGQALAYREAASHIVEAVAEAMDLLPAYEAVIAREDAEEATPVNTGPRPRGM